MTTSTVESELIATSPAAGVVGPDGGRRSILRTAFSFPVMLFGWVVLVVVRLAERDLPDPDIWWHLRNAQFLLANHRLPNFDAFSFTVAGHPWLNHEWLAEIPYYLAWRAFGLEGIEVLMLLLVEAIFLGVLYLSYQRSGRSKSSVIACWVALLFGTVNFGPRTILFGYACLVPFLMVLERYRSRGKAPLWVLPPLFCLWINLHGSWTLGMVILAIFIASGFIGGRWGAVEATRWTPGQAWRLIAVFAASCAALFVNPYGYRLVLYPLDIAVHQPLNMASVQEWSATDFHSVRGVMLLLLIGGLFATALRGRYRWKLADLLVIAFAVYSGITHERLLFLAGVVMAPVLAEIMDFVPPYQPEIDKPWLNALILAGILGFVGFRFPTPKALEQQVAEQYPASAAAYIETHPLQGRLLNYYEWGGYLGWKDPQLKVFVDSRVDIFEYAGVFKDYLDMIGLHDSFKVLDDYQIRYVLLPNGYPFASFLQAGAAWKVDYRDGLSVLFERVGAVPAGPPKDAAPRKVIEAW